MKIFHLFIAIVFLWYVPFVRAEPRACNGFESLCKKRYNEVVYPATHNGHSYKPSDVANQDLSLKEQFDLGIRATKLHVWYDKDSQGNVVPFVCHGIDKALLYKPPVDKIMEQVPFLFRSFARSIMEKSAPFKELVLEALRYAYGTDNSTGALPFRHCILDPASQPLYHALREVSTFLQQNPHEVMTLIVEDHTRNLPLIAQEFKKAGLLDMVHVQKDNEPWPTLNQMIDDNKRLVVFVHGDTDLPYQKFPWMHHLWHYAWDTKWDFKDVNLFKDTTYDTVPHRGKKAYERRNNEPKNKIFVVHHFITDLFGGSKNHALKANRKTVLRNRLKRLKSITGHIPNIVQVDFFEYPNNDFFSVINELNGV